ncbi:unnamed protein product [Meloidogyne enterolobii]|uniref:Uncharacterized protein n=1 Tax=Meloidogyne enterolobii TaxID=390850 RepID=A0ACB0YEL6_MELEN
MSHLTENFGIFRMFSKIMILFALCCICRLVNCSSNNNNINSAQHNNFRTRITPIIVGTEKELSTLLYNSFHQHPKNTLIKRALDMLEGDDFIGMQRKRALDLMEGDGFGGGFDRKRRALDMMEGDDFIGLKKRSNLLRKRALDILEGDDFVGMQKR